MICCIGSSVRVDKSKWEISKKPIKLQPISDLHVINQEKYSNREKEQGVKHVLSFQEWMDQMTFPARLSSKILTHTLVPCSGLLPDHSLWKPQNWSHRRRLLGRNKGIRACGP